MPVLLAILGLITTVLYFVLRARNAAHAATGLMDMANDVRLAARRFGFRRRANLHPAEAIEDPDIAIAGIASAFLELDELPTANQRTTMTRQLRETLSLSAPDADELTILGRWLVSECGTPDAAISRLSRKLQRLSGGDHFTPLLSILQSTLCAGAGQLSHRQKEALDDVKRAFRIT